MKQHKGAASFLWILWSQLLRNRSNKIFHLQDGECCRLWEDTFGSVTERWIRNISTPRNEFQSTASVSTTATGTTLLTTTTIINGHPTKILIDNGASENLCNPSWVQTTGQETTTGSKLCVKMANGVTTTTTKRIRGGELELGDHKSTITLVSLDLSRLDVILGQP
jgi:hypothetical protein